MQKTRYFYTFSLILTAFVVALLSSSASAAQFSVSPLLIDAEIMPGEEIHKKVLLTNKNQTTKYNIFVDVNNFSPTEGTQQFLPPSEADLSNSLANWIRVRRSVELLPGEQKEIDLLIDVDNRASPGRYHAMVSFARAHDRVSIPVNLKVGQNKNEDIQLKKFTSGRLFNFKSPVSFFYTVENIGDDSEKPIGEMIIYDRRGNEVDSMNINENGETIRSGEYHSFASIWENVTGFGRYKALLSLRYGTSNQKSLQDTIFFWVVPWPILVAVLLVIILTLAVLINMYSKHKESINDSHATKATYSIDSDDEE